MEIPMVALRRFFLQARANVPPERCSSIPLRPVVLLASESTVISTVGAAHRHQKRWGRARETVVALSRQALEKHSEQVSGHVPSVPGLLRPQGVPARSPTSPLFGSAGMICAV